MSVVAQPVTVFLRRPYLDALKRRAAELGLKDAQAAARMLEDILQPWLDDPVDADRISAERDLLALAADFAVEEAARRPWNEQLTLAVFERIRAEQLDLYRLATAGGHQDAVNRRIGRRVKDATGAQVKTVDDKPITTKVPASVGALIARYTLLEAPAGRRRRGSGSA